MNKPIKPSPTEIENPFAYRDCERWVHQEFGKKPLSAAFDKLGNNATLAITVARALRKEGFSLLPQDANTAEKAVIEVYPAIVKRGAKKIDRAIGALEKHIPHELEPGTDIYDAAICALIGAIHAGWGADHGLPALTSIPDGYDPKEGWIYSLPAEYVKAR